MKRMAAGLALIVVLGLVTIAAFGAKGGGSPQAMRSLSGMEGMKRVMVQVHVAGGNDWRELVDIDEAKLKGRVESLLHTVPGLTVVKGDPGEPTPRLLVIAVGHVIADPQGNKDTAATSLIMSLNQEVSLRRPVPGGKAVLLNGVTWERSVLTTGLKEKMRERVAGQLSDLAGEFKADYALENK